MNPCPIADWEHPVFTIDTDEAFRLAEYPPRRIIYDELSAPPVLVNRETFPELRTEEYPQMGVRQ